MTCPAPSRACAAAMSSAPCPECPIASTHSLSGSTISNNVSRAVTTCPARTVATDMMPLTGALSSSFSADFGASTRLCSRSASSSAWVSSISR